MSMWCTPPPQQQQPYMNNLLVLYDYVIGSSSTTAITSDIIFCFNTVVYGKSLWLVIQKQKWGGGYPRRPQNWNQNQRAHRNYCFFMGGDTSVSRAWITQSAYRSYGHESPKQSLACRLHTDNPTGGLFSSVSLRVFTKFLFYPFRSTNRMQRHWKRPSFILWISPVLKELARHKQWVKDLLRVSTLTKVSWLSATSSVLFVKEIPIATFRTAIPSWHVYFRIH